MALHLALQCAYRSDHLGYGTLGANLVKGFSVVGVDLWLPTEDEYSTVVPRDYRTVLWATMPGHVSGGWEGQRQTLMTMWEANRLPPGMRSRLGNFDTVFVPNDSNVDLFSRYHPNVVKVPLGYDAETWPYQPRDEPDDTFRFLFCGAGLEAGSRKGSDLAVGAFLRAFPDWQRMSPSPRLVTKSLAHPPPPHPWMESHVGKWPVDNLVALYRSCHAMILPSRGEGWGYHPQQAVATGMPAIVSEIPGHTEFSWAPGFLNVPTKLSKAAYFMYGEPGEWWEPDLDLLVDGLRDVYNHYDRWKAEAEEGGDVLRAAFTHREMARRVVEGIGAEDLVRCDTGEWRPFTERLYPLEVNRRLSPSDWQVGDRRSFELVPGERYWVDVHVHQVLTEAGYAANSDEDHAGLLPEDVPV